MAQKHQAQGEGEEEGQGWRRKHHPLIRVVEKEGELGAG